MKKSILTLVGICFLVFSCQNELIEFQESDSLSFSSSSSLSVATVSCEPDLDALKLSLPETVIVNTSANPCGEGDAFINVDIPDGSLASVGNPAWCADLDGFIGLSTYTFDVYSSYEDLSELVKNNGDILFENPYDFDRINWLLNQDIIGTESPNGGFYTFGHVQWAIWEIIEGTGNNCTDDCDYLSCNPINQWDNDKLDNERLGLELVVRADLEGEGFEPQCGDQIAIILASKTVQSLIITIDVPEKEIPCGECDGNVTELTLQYNGTEEANIRVETKDEGVNGSKVVFEGMVMSGGTFSFVGNDENGTFGEEIKVYVDGDYVKIKTDCSESIGPGLIVEDIEVISGMSLNGGELCPIPCEECKGGVTSFTFEYTGSDGSNLKVGYKDKDGVLYDGPVNYGDSITLEGTKDDGKFEENDLIFILDGVVLSAPEHDPGKIHVSCSKPFYVGLPIGDTIVVTAGTSKDNGPICPLEIPDCQECKGGVTSFTFEYTGSDAHLKVEHKNAVLFEGTVSNGQLITLSGSKDDGKFEENDLIFTLNGVVQSAPEHDTGKIHMSCSKPFYVGLPIGDNIVVIAGTSKDNGSICEGTPPIQPDCQECKGGVTSFTFEYTGSDAHLKVEHKNAVLFEGTVSNGQLITLSGSKDDGKFEENDLIFTLNGVVQSAPEHDTGKIHMSCSKPFYVGLPIGDNIVVIAGTSKDNGSICEGTPPIQPDCQECKGGVTSFTFEYTGSDAHLKVEHKNAVLFEGTVSNGQLITLSGSKDDGKFEENDLIFTLNGVVQSAPEHDTGKIHMSCSKPFYVGLPIGDNIVVIAGTSKDNGSICEGTAPPLSTACDCNGKIISMAVEYSGPNDATVTVGADENGNNSKTFTGVNSGDILNVTLGDIGNWWYWTVNGNVQASIHTSCSDDILGNIDAEKSDFGNLGNYPNPLQNSNNGTFLVVSHTDDNGNTCTLDGYVIEVPPMEPGNPGSTICDCDGKIVKMSVVYEGPNNATVTLGDDANGLNTLQTFTNVQSGDVLEGTIGDVGNWWYWSVDGNLQASIHTSCSDDILGNVDATKSIFGNLGNYPDPADDEGNTNDGTFLVTSHTDDKGNTCSL